jgi:uncharacterized protein YhaN
MATTPTPTASVPDAGKHHTPKRKALSKATKAKLAASLAAWRASLTPEAKAELRERSRRTQQERWASMSQRERRDALAGVKAWQRAQRDAKRAKPSGTPKASPKAEATTPAEQLPVGRSASRRSRKTVAK